MKFSATGSLYLTPPPALGRDSREVLEQFLGYDDDRIQALRQSRAVGGL
jgi:crotonobetainyl-CoA:carnitine CoA-transferase CaiB-like acyl-CoA transferase